MEEIMCKLAANMIMRMHMSECEHTAAFDLWKNSFASSLSGPQLTPESAVRKRCSALNVFPEFVGPERSHPDMNSK